MKKIFGCSRFARRYLGNRFCFLFLWLLRCFNSPSLLSLVYQFNKEYRGCPIRESSDAHISYYLRCIVGNHALHRLSMPRNPPYALKLLFLPNSRRLIFHQFIIFLLEVSGFEPLTSALQRLRSTNWAIPPIHRSRWAILDSNQGPYPYQGYALTNWANSPVIVENLKLFSSIKKRTIQNNRRYSNRTFQYGYLVTTSPRSPNLTSSSTS
jgi:hypothetical protein